MLSTLSSGLVVVPKAHRLHVPVFSSMCLLEVVMVTRELPTSQVLEGPPDTRSSEPLDLFLKKIKVIN